MINTVFVVSIKYEYFSENSQSTQLLSKVLSKVVQSKILFKNISTLFLKS